MKTKNSIESKSFIVLFTIAILGTFFAWASNKNYLSKNHISLFEQTAPANLEVTSTKPKVNEEKIVVDTNDWKIYKNETYGFEFKYKPDWKIGTIKNKEGYFVIQIDPGVKYGNIHIYISKNNYYALEGLPTEKIQIDGKEALNLDGMVLGIQNNAHYYTFDLGVSLTLKPLFEAMVNTIQFF